MSSVVYVYSIGMPLAEEVHDDYSEISKFLRYRLPGLPDVARSWEEQIAAGPAIHYVDDGMPQPTGHAIELLIDLDLANNPVRTALLKWLPPIERRFVLQASGIEVGEDIAAYAEPIQAQWRRFDRPERLDEAQQIVLDACYYLGAIMHLLRTDWLFRHIAECNIDTLRYVESDEPQTIVAPEMLRRSWQFYLDYGRKQFQVLGQRSQIAPVIAKGYAVGDVVQGETLIDIKAERDPKARMLPKLRQVMAYALLDKADQFGIRSVGIYSAFQCLLVSNNLESILAASTSGSTPQLAELRETLCGRMQTKLAIAKENARGIIW